MAGRGLIEKSSDRRWTVWHLVGDEPDSAQQQLALEPASIHPARRDRRAELRELLADGPRRTKELGAALDLTPQAVLKWLRRLEDDREVRPTSANRRSPKNRWQLVERQ
jgi:hypothetical protein